jgi:hypothetical protein
MHFRFRLTSMTVATIAFVAGAAACQTKTGASTTSADTTKAMAGMDKDVNASGGTGAPTGYQGRTDRPTQKLSDAKYVKGATGYEVTTGPAHILWKPADTASGNYTVSATIDQLATPKHPEAFGIFVGGSDLSGPTQSYLYFLVRGTGEIFAQSRKGDVLTGRIAWQKSYAAPVQDANGKASYTLAIRVAGDSIHFLVNSHQAAVLPKKDMPTAGIFGLRINHNLHVHATPATITRP